MGASIAGRCSLGVEIMKHAAVLLSVAIVLAGIGRLCRAQDGGVSSKASAPATSKSSASASSKSSVPVASKSSASASSKSSAHGSLPPAPRRGTLTKRRIPPPPRHHVRGRTSLTGKSRANSGLLDPDPTGRIDQAGKAAPFYPSARTLNTAQRQKSATVAFPEAKPDPKNANPNP